MKTIKNSKICDILFSKKTQIFQEKISYLQFHDFWFQKFESQNVKNERRVQFKPDITTIFTSSLLLIKMALIPQVQPLTIESRKGLIEASNWCSHDGISSFQEFWWRKNQSSDRISINYKEIYTDVKLRHKSLFLIKWGQICKLLIQKDCQRFYAKSWDWSLDCTSCTDQHIRIWWRILDVYSKVFDFFRLVTPWWWTT